MGMIPPDMPQDEYDRRAIEEIKARRAANPDAKSYSSERMSQFIADLQARFRQAGGPDPAVAAQLLAEMRAEAPE